MFSFDYIGTQNILKVDSIPSTFILRKTDHSFDLNLTLFLTYQILICVHFIENNIKMCRKTKLQIRQTRIYLSAWQFGYWHVPPFEYDVSTTYMQRGRQRRAKFKTFRVPNSKVAQTTSRSPRTMPPTPPDECTKELFDTASSDIDVQFIIDD